MRLRKNLFCALKGLDASTVLQLDYKDGRKGLGLYYQYERSPKCAKLSDSIYFLETSRLKSFNNFPGLRFSSPEL